MKVTRKFIPEALSNRLVQYLPRIKVLQKHDVNHKGGRDRSEFRVVLARSIKMTTDTIPTTDQLAASDMVQQTLSYWFADHEHVRSPLPFYIHDELRGNSVEAFQAWMSKLNAKAKEEITEEIAHEKFEEVLFEQAARLVKTDDEILTLRFPFLPRVGDNIDGGVIEGRSGENVILGRLLQKEEKDEFMQMDVMNSRSLQKWTTRFELP